ncbi:alpha/beta hydrolase [Albimonas sp. CAU 1670]|uniref:alpha/beta hydrolase n=1 Tax=Albimonas sp. CAU 1670 TaxID=3032599 RepID=UPI0023DAEB86|nr:alpha/beta hydrolase [Albimonas sp. CAU 1670]MDF2232427.1 alpha/beta hydrolase [Albimonas sp. CAU 1670]
MHSIRVEHRSGAAPAAGPRRRLRRLLALPLLLLAACSGSYDELELLPPPILYSSGALDPFAGIDSADYALLDELLYVTGRRPAAAGEPQAHYADARAPVMRAGVARVKVDPPFRDLDEIRAATVMGEDGAARTISVASVEEIGVLPAGLTDFHALSAQDPAVAAAGEAFAARVDQHLAVSGRRDVFIFVHGYNVNFEYPLLVSREWQHYLGDAGAFIAFAWPATPSRFAYFKDIETAEASVRDLRVLLDFLRDRTQVERIHLIGYSAGSRLVLRTLQQTALMHAGGAAAPPLGEVILIGSDVDPKLFLQVLADGALEVVERLMVYMSGTDSALSMSALLLDRRPLGRSWSPEEAPAEIVARLAELDTLELIDVTASENVDAGNGHWYFRASPWVRSDLVGALLSREPAARRGLTRPPGEARWRFPEDYPARLEAAVKTWTP